MHTRKFLTFTTHVDFVNRGFVNEVLHRNMFRVSDSFRFYVSTLWVLVFGIFSHMFSFKDGKCHQKNQYGCNDQDDTNCYKEGTKVEEFAQTEKGFQGDGEQVSNTGGKETCVAVEIAMASSTSKYEFLSGKHISGFIEEPKSFIFSVQEFYMDSNNFTDCDNRILVPGEGFDQKRAEDSVDKVLEKEEEKSILDAVKVCDGEKAEDSVVKVLKNQGEIFAGNESRVFTEFRFLPRYDISNEVPPLSEDGSLPVDSKVDAIGLSNGFSMTNNNFELYSYEFLSERNFSELETESIEALSEEKVESTESILDQATSVMQDETFESDDEYIELQPESPSSRVLDEEIWSTKNFIQAEEDLFHEQAGAAESHRTISEESPLENSNVNEAEDNHEDFDLVYEHPVDSSVKFEEYSLEENEFISDSDDEDEDEDDLDFASEDDDIIEQLKMEMKNARTGGLPTILEESESPLKMVEELRPLKIDYKFDHKDRMIEIHKVYRSYLDKMRKLDILNSQNMHAIGLLQLKRPPGQLINSQKSVPVIKSLLSQNLWSCKPPRCEANRTLKHIGDLRKDFEVVYVGQLCLSWEILHWQYRKALELQEFDAQELRWYNQVAGDFQLFQVLLQRFVENEPFQSYPRVQNYVNNRCVYCDLLQVPVIKDDSLKDMKGRRDGEDAITSPMLTEIIEESMRVFWEFLRTDRAETDIILKGQDLQDSIGSELLIDIRTDFQKKEKRLKEILRSSSCIVKKLQKYNENRSNHAMLFAQVDLKLISRVLTMSKLTTDQLVWCREKLDRINFWNRKLVIEPSFLLFPC